ncbi:chloride channel protein [Algiphilus sp.]|uniref:chloride channel protein n=1 Tax=Algiphilus sp. TaxID=1872431 RepID=UPI0025C02592|nr:chloride channel protein [Algiphilus sp.]MCK5770983.1 chloride channel protein [Algiphilus sp.]
MTEGERDSDGQADDAAGTAPLPGAAMLGLAIIIGIAGGFGAIAFKAIIAFFHNLMFRGELGLVHDPTAVIAPSPLGAWIILVPVAGAALVTLITSRIAPEARGGGVPEVLNAIYYEKGRIRPVVALAKAAASAISIGTGGSVGREGPMVQIGSTVGSAVATVARIPVRQRITLIAAGAAAAVAGTFNAPIGGMAFALELLLVSLSARTVSLVAVASVTATGIGRLYSGLDPAFNVPEIAQFEGEVTGLFAAVLCVPFGVLVGVAAAGFIRGLYRVEDFFEQRFANPYLRHMCGMLLVGLMMYALLRATGQYHVAGVGYPTVLDVLRGVLSDPLFLLLLCAAKMLATALTLGSGASGGVFAPSLFLGATLGAAVGNALAMVAPAAGIDPVVFAVAGMAGMVGGTSGAVITAITMTLEQTRDYGAMLPIITTVALAHMVRVRLVPQSIYTLKLARRGMRVPEGLQAAVSATHNARTVMTREFELLDVGAIEDWKAGYRPGDGAMHTVVCRDGEVLGLARPDLLYLLRDEAPDTVVDTNYLAAAPTSRWAVIMRGLRAKGTDTALVFNPRGSRRQSDLVGVITSHEIARAAREGADLLD